LEVFFVDPDFVIPYSCFVILLLSIRDHFATGRIRPTAEVVMLQEFP